MRLTGFLTEAVARLKNTLLSIPVQIWSFVRTDPFLSVTNFLGSSSHQSRNCLMDAYAYTCSVMNIPFATWDRLAAVLIGPDTNCPSLFGYVAGFAEDIKVSSAFSTRSRWEKGYQLTAFIGSIKT